MKYQAVIFDLDNLLVDSEHLWPKIDNDFFTEYLGEKGWQAWQPLWLEQKRNMVQLKLIMADLKQRFNKSQSPEEIIDLRMAKMFKAYQQELKPMPGASEILNDFNDQGLKIGIASGMNMKVIDFVVDLFGWNDFISAKASTHDCEHNKPFPDVYLRAAKLLAEEPRQCLAFENDLNGVKAAKAAGMFAVAVPYPDKNSAEIKSMADLVLSSLKEKPRLDYLL